MVMEIVTVAVQTDSQSVQCEQYIRTCDTGRGLAWLCAHTITTLAFVHYRIPLLFRNSLKRPLCVRSYNTRETESGWLTVARRNTAIPHQRLCPLQFYFVGLIGERGCLS